MSGGSVQPVHADLATHEAVHALTDAIRAAGRTPEAVAINAGRGRRRAVPGDGPGRRAEPHHLQRHLHCAPVQARAARHVKASRGRVLYTVSIAAQMPASFEAVYAASRAFVHSFALAMRNELEDTGVTVTSLIPGPT